MQQLLKLHTHAQNSGTTVLKARKECIGDRGRLCEGRGLRMGFTWVFGACGCHSKLMHVQRHVPAAASFLALALPLPLAVQIPGTTSDAKAARVTNAALQAIEWGRGEKKLILSHGCIHCRANGAQGAQWVHLCMPPPRFLFEKTASICCLHASWATVNPNPNTTATLQPNSNRFQFTASAKLSQQVYA